jgi:hypothetical protein
MSTPTKDELRHELLSQSHAIRGDTLLDIINSLAKVLHETPDLRSVLLYKPVAKWGELDVTSLPAMFSNVKFVSVKNTKDAPFPKVKFDVVVIPLVGFNGDGQRLGHGGGWYDKFLATQPKALKIGIGYEDTLRDFTAEPHDIPMDIIISDQQIRFFQTS